MADLSGFAKATFKAICVTIITPVGWCLMIVKHFACAEVFLLMSLPPPGEEATRVMPICQRYTGKWDAAVFLRTHSTVQFHLHSSDISYFLISVYLVAS